MSVRFAHLLGATPPGQEGSLLSIFYQVFYPDTKLSEIVQEGSLLSIFYQVFYPDTKLSEIVQAGSLLHMYCLGLVPRCFI
jgi:hypothetical protein